MRIMLVHPTHDYSTHDVYQGLLHGLRAEGHDVFPYDLGMRMDMAGAALVEAHRQSKLGAEFAPGLAQVRYEAGLAAYAAVMSQGIDYVVIITGLYWDATHTRNFRWGNVKVGIVHTEAPYMDAMMVEQLAGADVVWVNERGSVSRLEHYMSWLDSRPSIRYLPHGYHPEKHNTAEWPEAGVYPDHDVVFVGTGFEERVRLLESAFCILGQDGVDFGLYGHWGLLQAPAKLGPKPGKPFEPTEAHKAKLVRASERGKASPLWRYYQHGVVPNHVTSMLYRRARVGLNLFRSSETFSQDATKTGMVAESMNPRCYELAACGAFFLSERRAEVADVFGDTVPMFDGPEELAQLIRYYLANPDERSARAAELAQLVQPHSYVHRARQLADDLRGLTTVSGRNKAP